jgi:hypothetical protein
MSSLRSAIERARQTGKLGAVSSGRVRDLARAVGLPAPVSVRDLIGALDRLRKPADPPHPHIDVRSEGAGAAATFVVAGTDFRPNHTVTVRVVDDALTTLTFQQSADADGQLVLRQSIPCMSGLRLHFSATDSRPDSADHTGVSWSNTVDTSCP